MKPVTKLKNKKNGYFSKMNGKNLLFASLAFLVLCGCGYVTSSVMSSAGDSIHIDNFINKIDLTQEVSDSKAYHAYIPAMELDVTREVINKFLLDGNYKVKDAGKARFILRGALVDFIRDPLRYDANDNVIEYRLRVIVDIKLYDREKDEIVWVEKNFAGESTYRTTGQFSAAESSAVQAANKDLARRIVERTVENW